MRVAGIMSGTSLDGIDVAIVDIRGKKIEPVAFHTRSLPQGRARGDSGRVQHDDPHLGHRAAALPAGRTLRRSRSRNLPPPPRSPALDFAVRPARPDDFSRRRAGELPRPPRREHAFRSATPRSWPSAPASGPSPISASAISPPEAAARRWCPGRLPVVPPSPHRPRRAEPRRHRQHHRDSRPAPRATTSWRSTPAPATW